MKIFILVIISLLIIVSDIIQEQFNIKQKSKIFVDLIIILISTICACFYLYFDLEKDVIKSVLYTLGYLIFGILFLLVLNLLDDKKINKIKSYELDALKCIENSDEIINLRNIVMERKIILNLNIITSDINYDNRYHSEIKISLVNVDGNEIESMFIPIIDCSKKKIYIEYINELNEINKLSDIIKISD